MNTSQIYAILGKLIANGKELEKLSTADAQWLFRNPKQALSLLIKSIEIGNCLRPIKDKKRLVIPACDGTKSFSDVQSIVVPSQDELKYYCANRVGSVTEEIEVERFEPLGSLSYLEIFTSFGCDLKELLFTPHQIIIFADINRMMLFKESRSMSFLLESDVDPFYGTQLLVASIFFNSAEGYAEDIPWIDIAPFSSLDYMDPSSKNIVIPARKR